MELDLEISTREYIWEGGGITPLIWHLDIKSLRVVK